MTKSDWQQLQRYIKQLQRITELEQQLAELKSKSLETLESLASSKRD